MMSLFRRRMDSRSMSKLSIVVDDGGLDGGRADISAPFLREKESAFDEGSFVVFLVVNRFA